MQPEQDGLHHLAHAFQLSCQLLMFIEIQTELFGPSLAHDLEAQKRALVLDLLLYLLLSQVELVKINHTLDHLSHDEHF